MFGRLGGGELVAKPSPTGPVRASMGVEKGRLGGDGLNPPPIGSPGRGGAHRGRRALDRPEQGLGDGVGSRRSVLRVIARSAARGLLGGLGARSWDAPLARAPYLRRAARGTRLATTGRVGPAGVRARRGRDAVTRATFTPSGRGLPALPLLVLALGVAQVVRAGVSGGVTPPDHAPERTRPRRPPGGRRRRQRAAECRHPGFAACSYERGQQRGSHEGMRRHLVAISTPCCRVC